MKAHCRFLFAGNAFTGASRVLGPWAVAALVLLFPLQSGAQGVPLVFQTTFNCPDWNQSMGLSDSNV
jgi:hypothetical protein